MFDIIYVLYNKWDARQQCYPMCRIRHQLREKMVIGYRFKSAQDSISYIPIVHNDIAVAAHRNTEDGRQSPFAIAPLLDYLDMFHWWETCTNERYLSPLEIAFVSAYACTRHENRAKHAINALNNAPAFKSNVAWFLS